MRQPDSVAHATAQHQSTVSRTVLVTLSCEPRARRTGINGVGFQHRADAVDEVAIQKLEAKTNGKDGS